MLTDVGFSQSVAMYRQGQGLGYTSIPTNLGPVTATNRGNAVVNSFFNGTSTYGLYQSGQNSYTPTSTPGAPPMHHIIEYDPNNKPQQSIYNSNGAGGLLTTNNFVTFPYMKPTNIPPSPTDTYVD